MSDGDTLVIRDGTYNQPLVVRRDSITIRAETRGRVVFDMLGEQDHAVVSILLFAAMHIKAHARHSRLSLGRRSSAESTLRSTASKVSPAC